MKFRNIFILVVFFIVFGNSSVFSQELNCFVTINSSQIEGTNKEIFNTLRDALTDFMNNRTWTNNVFEVNERIECNLLLNIQQEVTTGVYEASLSVQARRPVFGTSYNSVMFNYFDNDVKFEYTEYDPMEFSETTHLNNLTSVLAYYAYVIIGLDYDSFSPEGGTPYFEKAEKIVTNAQSASGSGWRPTDSKGRRNRYWLVDNILDEDYTPIRNFNYTYHRLGLDVMDKAVERGRLVIKEAIIELERFNKEKPDPFMHYFQITIETKSDEIVQIFSQATPDDKTRIYGIMTALDPSNSKNYEPLKQ